MILKHLRKSDFCKPLISNNLRQKENSALTKVELWIALNSLMWYSVIMIKVNYILHNLDKNGNRLDTYNFIRSDIVEKIESVFDMWAYLSNTEVEIPSTREVTEEEVATSKATANRIASDYRPGVYNGD